MKVDFYATAPRYVQIIAGLVMVIAALVLTLVVIAGLSVILDGNTSSENMWTLIICTLAGAGCWLLAWRLLSGKGRRDGGLFSPAFLRVASLVFLVAGPVMIMRHPLGIVEAVAAVGAAGACFGLARFRERQISQGEGDVADR